MKQIQQSVYTFDKNNPPVERVCPGEELLFCTMDCFGNQIQSEEQLVAQIDFSRTNPAAGPVYIEGAEVGDVLVVDILDIQVAKQGFVCTSGGCGPLIEDSELRTRLVKVENKVATFRDLSFLVEPMIGVIGTAPDGDAIATGHPGPHGGNMDSKKITKGARVYLPVRVPGALLQMGDLHAAMGDSELCGTGVEIAGEILVRVNLIKHFPLNWPVTETATHWYVNASGKTYEETLKAASLELRRLMEPVYGWDKTDLYLYLSIQGDVEINQACRPVAVDMILRFGIPKIPGKRPLIG